MTVDNISILKGYLKSFVTKADIVLKKAEYRDWEPPLDKSHIWAELVSSVEHARDTLEMLE